MSHVRSRRRGRIHEDQDIQSEGEEGSLNHSTNDIDSSSDDDYDEDDDEGDTSSSDESSSSEDDQDTNDSESENTPEVETDAIPHGHAAPKGPAITMKTAPVTVHPDENVASDTINTTSTEGELSHSNMNKKDTAATTPPTETTVQAASASSTLSPTASATARTEELSEREKQILERREYRRKLAEDPSFVPYVGMFWSHDDRYRQDALRPALDNASDPSEKFMRIHHHRRSEKNEHSEINEKKGMSGGGRRQHHDKNYRRVPDEIINSKWTHDGYEMLVRMEEEDQQRKREGLPPKNRHQQQQQQFYRRRPSHQQQRRERRPSASNKTDGANSSWQSFDPKNILTHEKQWPTVDSTKEKENTEIKKETTNDVSEMKGRARSSSNNNAWSHFAAENDRKAQKQVNGSAAVASPEDNWAKTRANTDWKSFSTPNSDGWDASNGSAWTVKDEIGSGTNMNGKEKATFAAATTEKKKEGDEVVKEADGWGFAGATVGQTPEAMGWGSSVVDDQVKTDGWPATASPNKNEPSSKLDETGWGSITATNTTTATIEKEPSKDEGWDTIDASKADGWSTNASDQVWGANIHENGVSQSTSNDDSKGANDNWKNAASWNTTTTTATTTTVEKTTSTKQQLDDPKKSEQASAAWGAWSINNSSNSADTSQQQQQPQRQRRGRGYLSQKKPVNAPAEQQKATNNTPVKQVIAPEAEALVATSAPYTNSVPPVVVQTEKTPAYEFSSFQQNAPWSSATSTRDDAWGHGKFIEEDAKEDQESDVEIILEEEPENTTPTLNRGRKGSGVSYSNKSDQDEVLSKRRADGANRHQQQQQQRRMDDDWRRRDNDQVEVIASDLNSPYIHEMQPNPYYYQQPMGGYMPISSALPQAYGVPLQPIPMSASPAEGGSVYNGDASDSSQQQQQQQQQQYMPPAYEANGMVYYGMDPSATMYPYCYYPPPQSTMAVPPPMMSQQLYPQHGGVVVVDDDDDNEEAEEEGWGVTPQYIHEEWQRSNQTSPNNAQQQQQPVNAFYYYSSPSAAYYPS